MTEFLIEYDHYGQKIVFKKNGKELGPDSRIGTRAQEEIQEILLPDSSGNWKGLPEEIACECDNPKQSFFSGDVWHGSVKIILKWWGKEDFAALFHAFDQYKGGVHFKLDKESVMFNEDEKVHDELENYFRKEKIKDIVAEVTEEYEKQRAKENDEMSKMFDEALKKILKAHGTDEWERKMSGMSEEMQKMAGIVKKYDSVLRKYDYKRYVAPDIPDKIMEKLIKYWDTHLTINNVVAFYDSTLRGNAKGGILFTGDGFYDKFMGKPVYFNYKDIIDIHFSPKNDNLNLKLNSDDVSEYTLYNSSLDKRTLKTVLEELIAISKASGRDALKSTGKVKKMDLPPEMMKKCKAIIHSAATACGGAGTGLAQIPASDNAVIVPIQIGMIVSLGKVFELNITESAAKGIIASAGATVAGRTASQFLVGWIPIIGNAINTATAASVTEAIGWIAVKNFYERWLEDRTKGRYEGMKDGFVECSWEYEAKLKKQAQEFLNQIKDVKRERDEYEKLLDECEAYIEKLERSNSEADSINEMKEIYSNLKSLKSV